MENAKKMTPLFGRMILAAIFLMSGLGKIGAWDGTAGYMASKGMPLVPLFLFGAIVLEILGGASIILGFKARWGAVALIVFLVPATLIFHNFWAFEGQAMQLEMIQFLKNGSILGGLLMVVVHGSGAYSLDSRFAKATATGAKATPATAAA